MTSIERYETIKIEKEEGVVWITLNRPTRLNAINLEMLNELLSVLEEVEGDEEVRCVILTGAGNKAFSVGADITSFVSKSPRDIHEIIRQGQRLMSKIENSSKIYIAIIKGYCLGGGLEPAISCDFRIAAENAELGFPEINLGIIPGWGGTQRLPRIVGLGKAKEFIMLGNVIHAQDALEIGLVNKVVPIDNLIDEVREVANRIVKGSSVALKYAKYVLNLDIQIPLESRFRIETETWFTLFSTKDAEEGLRAFIEKRKPVFMRK